MLWLQVLRFYYTQNDQNDIMPKYTETPGDLTIQQWLKRLANEMAEYNRLKRIEFVLVGKMSVVDPTTQDDNA